MRRAAAGLCIFSVNQHENSSRLTDWQNGTREKQRKTSKNYSGRNATFTFTITQSAAVKPREKNNGFHEDYCV